MKLRTIRSFRRLWAHPSEEFCIELRFYASREEMDSLKTTPLNKLLEAS